MVLESPHYLHYTFINVEQYFCLVEHVLTKHVIHIYINLLQNWMRCIPVHLEPEPICLESGFSEIVPPRVHGR